MQAESLFCGYIYRLPNWTYILIVDMASDVNFAPFRFQGPPGDNGPTGDPGRPGKDVSILISNNNPLAKKRDKSHKVYNYRPLGLQHVEFTNRTLSLMLNVVTNSKNCPFNFLPNYFISRKPGPFALYC